MKRILVAALLMCLLWCLRAEAYFILHIGADLARPEMYVPSEEGLRPRPGLNPRPVFYTIDAKGYFLVPDSEIAIFRSFQHWNNVSGATALFIPGGIKFYPPDAEWTGFPDGDNALIWVQEGWIFGPEIIALTYIMTDNTTGAIDESDIYINAEHYSWGILDGSRDHPDSMTADVENIITHEAGHMLGLAHSQFREATMSGAIGLGQTRRRTLHQDDMEALRYQYPATEADYPGPSLWGIRKGNCFFDDSLYSPYIEIDSGAGSTEFCLFGAGFYSADVSASLEKYGQAITPNPVSGASCVSENLVSASLDYSSLGTSIYDPAVTSPNGKTGTLFQGVVINQAGNQLPVAMAGANPEEVEAGGYVNLDGSASYDPEGSDISYQWLVGEAPGEVEPVFSNPCSAITTVGLERLGIYIFYLVVNDGIVDSIADSVTVTALPAEGDHDDDDDLFFGCMQIDEKSINGFGQEHFLNLLIVTIPLIVAGLLKLHVYTKMGSCLHIKHYGNFIRCADKSVCGTKKMISGL
jgi:hypothetical protein